MEVIHAFVKGACKKGLELSSPTEEGYLTLSHEVVGVFDIHKPIPTSITQFMDSLQIPMILIYPTTYLPALSDAWAILYVRFTLTEQGKRRYEYVMSEGDMPWKGTDWNEQYERWKVQQLGTLITM